MEVPLYILLVKEAQNPKNRLLSKCWGMHESISGADHSCTCRFVWELRILPQRPKNVTSTQDINMHMYVLVYIFSTFA